MKTFLPLEHNRDPSRTDRPARPCASLHFSRTLESLGGGGFVPLSRGYGTRLLVSLAFLDSRGARRRTDFANVASLGGFDICGFARFHVHEVVETNEVRACRQRMVEISPLLHHESGRQNAACRPLQCRAEDAVLELFPWWSGALADRARAVVQRRASLEFALAPVCRGDFASYRRAYYDWEFHDPRVHGRVRGARRVWLRHPRRCVHGVRETLPSDLV